MRRAIPDDNKKRFAGVLIGSKELKSFADNDFRGIAAMLFYRSLPTHQRIIIKEVADAKPSVKTKGAGIVRVFFENGNSRPAQAVQMPFAKMRGGVAVVPKGLGGGFFLETQRIAVVKNAGAVVASAGENGGPSGRTIGSAGVKVSEPQAIGRHSVKVRGFEMRMVLIADLSPALVIRHNENNMRRFRRPNGRRASQKERNQ